MLRSGGSAGCPTRGGRERKHHRGGLRAVGFERLALVSGLRSRLGWEGSLASCSPMAVSPARALKVGKRQLTVAGRALAALHGVAIRYLPARRQVRRVNELPDETAAPVGQPVPLFRSAGGHSGHNHTSLNSPVYIGSVMRRSSTRTDRRDHGETELPAGSVPTHHGLTLPQCCNTPCPSTGGTPPAEVEPSSHRIRRPTPYRPGGLCDASV